MEREFTVEEANALLPHIEPLVRALQALSQEAEGHAKELELARAVGYGPDGELIMAVDYRKSRAELARILAEARAILARIHGYGCLVKDIRLGLVDFPARVGGEEVLLCWRLGEPAVLHYHRPAEGFAGRKPLQPPDRRQ